MAAATSLVATTAKATAGPAITVSAFQNCEYKDVEEKARLGCRAFLCALFVSNSWTDIGWTP
jgi:hypothetical protein